MTRLPVLHLSPGRAQRVTLFFLLLFCLSMSNPVVNSAATLIDTEPAQPEVASEVIEPEDEPVVNEQVSDEGSPDQNSAIDDPVDPEIAQVGVSEDLPVKEETRERERGAGEDPLAQDLSAKEDTPERQLFRPNKLELYGSVRIRYVASDYQNEFNDGGSRFGLNGELQFHPKFWLLGRAEAGINLLGTLGDVFGNSGNLGDGENVSRRLLYAAVESPSAILIYGKNWSTYYLVSGLTDRFSSFGGDASGTFNAYTDGGSTGTGRADNVLQSRMAVDFLPERLKIKPFKLHLQVQQGQSIPFIDDAQYNYSFGLSGMLETEGEFNLGIAYNHAVIDDEDRPALSQKGITGDARALVLGTRVFGEKVYLATTVAFTENHETTDEGLYFDGWGWEVFGSYKLFEKWWVLGGLNLLEPYDDELLAKEYRIRYAVLGLRYSFEGFHKMLYAEIRLDDSLTAAGNRVGNIYTAGVRWDLP